MKEQLNEIRQKAISRLENSDTLAALEELRLQFLGKKGEVTALLKQMGKLSPEERPVMGQLANQVRSDIEEMLAERKQELEAHALDAKLKAEAVDVTIPGDEMTFGHQHPMNQVLQEIKDIFTGMGYQIVDGPEVELAEYNFTRLNIEEGHPSRDRSDTFYFTDDDSLLLRTQTSPMQVRVMENTKPPICILAPGRVYRKDEADATRLGMNAGLDMEMETGHYVQNLRKLIADGKVSEAQLDSAVSAILYVKFALGLFDDPFVHTPQSAKYAPAHLAAAKEAALQSAILLKNENSALPLKSGKQKRVLLTGPLADARYDQLGTWIFDGEKEHTVTLRQGLDELCRKKGMKLDYVESLKYTRHDNPAGIDAAVAAAANADVLS